MGQRARSGDTKRVGLLCQGKAMQGKLRSVFCLARRGACRAARRERVAFASCLWKLECVMRSVCLD